jgi:branched-chain amino acid transport system ATP-binding protein
VAVNDLSFTVEKEQVFGIAGPNGAGKSTIYNLISGVCSFEGRIEFEGRDISRLQPHRISKLGIARTFQIPRTFPSLTVEESISVGN